MEKLKNPCPGMDLESFSSKQDLIIEKMRIETSEKKWELVQKRMDEIQPGLIVKENTDLFSMKTNPEGATIIYYKKAKGVEISVITFMPVEVSTVAKGNTVTLEAEFYYV